MIRLAIPWPLGLVEYGSRSWVDLAGSPIQEGEQLAVASAKYQANSLLEKF
jgi:hypothetical protein